MVNKPKQVNGFKNKLIDWRGSSFKDLTDEKIFSLNAKREAGYQLRQVINYVKFREAQNPTIGSHSTKWALELMKSLLISRMDGIVLCM
jgi:hypothetical protein